jgi:hypothetical protein
MGVCLHGRWGEDKEREADDRDLGVWMASADYCEEGYIRVFDTGVACNRYVVVTSSLSNIKEWRAE